MMVNHPILQRIYKTPSTDIVVYNTSTYIDRQKYDK